MQFRRVIHCLLAVLLTGSFAKAQEVRGFIDLQMHPAIHLTYGFFGEGLTWIEKGKEPKLSYNHTFTNVNYADYWKDNAGARIIVPGALNPEYIRNRKKARENILEQIRFVNDFAEKNSDEFVVAKSPQEARDLILNTDKTVIIHSIEGGRALINSAEDARFWADQGVAFITLVHLVDCEYGGSAIKVGTAPKFINLKGSLRKAFCPNKRRGLTEQGKQAILWMAQAGIMCDLTHMSIDTKKDAIAFMAENGIPPIFTHDVYKPIQNQPRGLDNEDIWNVYKAGGFVSLPISGISDQAYHPAPWVQAELDSMKDYCSGSIDSYIYTYEKVKDVVEDNVWRIAGNAHLTFDDLTESEKVRYSIGFQSDFNGWLEHSRPRYGKEGCFEAQPGQSYEIIETEGMPHPGFLESQWRYMEKKGVDIEPIRRNAELFLQIWQQFLDNHPKP